MISCWVGTEADAKFRLRGGGCGVVVVLFLWALVNRLSIYWTTRAVLPNGRGMFVCRTSSLGVCGELLVEMRELQDAAAAW